jgi:outer membrane lipoprotein-sorting protein
MSAVFAVEIAAQDVEAVEILGAADRSRGNSGGLEWQITLEEGGEKADEETNVMIVKSKMENSMAFFLEPRSSKGQKMVMKQRNMWFIKPGVSKPVSISPRQKLMGGASNADIASTNYAGDYDAVLLSTEEVNGVPCYVFDLTGKTKSVTYDKIKYWVSTDRNLGLKAEFYSVSGKLLKTAFFQYEQTVEIDGKSIPFVSEMRIVDSVQADTETIMTYEDVKVKKIPSSEFSLQN